MEKIPQHVSIIMDGNGRWAKARGLDRVKGHIEGVESVRACLEAAAEDGVKYLSVYAFSEENWNRPQDEVIALMELMMKAMKQELNTFMDNNIRFMVLGNRARLSEGLNQTIDDMMEHTAGNTRCTLILFRTHASVIDRAVYGCDTVLQCIGDCFLILTGNLIRKVTQMCAKNQPG